MIIFINQIHNALPVEIALKIAFSDSDRFDSYYNNSFIFNLI